MARLELCLFDFQFDVTLRKKIANKAEDAISRLEPGWTDKTLYENCILGLVGLLVQSKNIHTDEHDRSSADMYCVWEGVLHSWRPAEHFNWIRTIRAKNAIHLVSKVGKTFGYFVKDQGTESRCQANAQKGKIP